MGRAVVWQRLLLGVRAKNSPHMIVGCFLRSACAACRLLGRAAALAAFFAPAARHQDRHAACVARPAPCCYRSRAGGGVSPPPALRRGSVLRRAAAAALAFLHHPAHTLRGQPFLPFGAVPLVCAFACARGGYVRRACSPPNVAPSISGRQSPLPCGHSQYSTVSRVCGRRLCPALHSVLLPPSAKPGACARPLTAPCWSVPAQQGRKEQTCYVHSNNPHLRRRCRRRR